MNMKRTVSALIFSAAAIFALSGTMNAAGTNVVSGMASSWPFYVYTDAFSRLNHYAATGWMGDINDMRFTDKWLTAPKSDKTCIRIEYSGKRSNSQGWAGIYWQNPAMNWGNMKGGFDISGAKTVSFWARGEKGDEVAEFKIGGIKGEYRDTASASTGQLTMTTNWKRYGIDLSSYDLSTVIGGFCVVFDKLQNPKGCVIFIDDIAYDTNTMETIRKSNNPGTNN